MRSDSLHNPQGAVLPSVNLEAVKAYGDTLNDGAMQLSFTLPVPAGRQAEEAAKLLIAKMGMEEPLITAIEPMGPGLTYFVAYARCPYSVDYAAIDAVLKISDFALANADTLAELDINPLIVCGEGKGAWVADALLVTSEIAGEA